LPRRSDPDVEVGPDVEQRLDLPGGRVEPVVEGSGELGERRGRCRCGDRVGRHAPYDLGLPRRSVCGAALATRSGSTRSSSSTSNGPSFVYAGPGRQPSATSTCPAARSNTRPFTVHSGEPSHTTRATRLTGSPGFFQP